MLLLICDKHKEGVDRLYVNYDYKTKHYYI